MTESNGDTLNQLVQAVLASPKDRNICRDLIERIGSNELSKRSSLKESTKATKNKLHQVGGAYLDAQPDYQQWTTWLEEMEGINDWDAYRLLCRKMMQSHSSTRERLGSLDHFYTQILAGISPLRRVLDLACGLHPLGLPWMNLPEGVAYTAIDIYTDMMGFLSRFLENLPVRGTCQAADVLQFDFNQDYDLVFLLKSIPCLEQIDKSAGQWLLDHIRSQHIIISFPIHSLGGRSKGMAFNYERRFNELSAGKDWSIRCYEFPSELVFRVSR